MGKKYFIFCILFDIAVVALGFLNVFLLNCNIPELACVAASLIVLVSAVFFFVKWKEGKADRAVVGVLAAFTIIILIAGSYCNPYWNGNTFLANADRYSRSYDDVLSADEAMEDLEYAMKYLKKLHPAFYNGVPETISQQYERVKARIENCDSICVSDLAGEIETIFSILRDGHTYVRGNYADRRVLKYYREWADAGYEITAVNGISIEELLEQKSEYYSFEVTSWQMEWLSDDIATLAGIDYLGFDVDEEVEYTLTAADGRTETKICYWDDFVTWDEYAGIYNLDETETEENDFVSYEIDTEKSIAILNLDECIYNSQYINCVREMFEKVKADKIENVVVDLRANGGGNSQVVSEFFRYLDIDSYGTASMGWRLGFLYLKLGSGVAQNEKQEDLLFDGSLYLLTSAGTFSSAMMFAEYVKDNKLGTIIGEAPGNNPNGYGEVVFFKLPESGLFMQISTKRFYRADRECTDELVYPDIECDSDLAMEELYRLLNETAPEQQMEDAAEEDKADNAGKEEGVISADEQETEPLETDNVITAYLTEDVEYSDEALPVQYVDDLSLIEGMKDTNNIYAYQDGKVYYRRYHEDSYQETALWANYDFVPETKKEIVCIDTDGNVAELFADEGFGNIYLIDDRFYMTDGKLNEESGMVDRQLYSVDTQGNSRINYGDGNILAIDRARKLIILQVQETEGIGYYALNYETGEKKKIFWDSEELYTVIYFWAYQDGWIYYTEMERKNNIIDKLCAVSLDGEYREIIALTSDINKKESYTYRESILHVEVDGDRIYFIFGGYDGTAHVFQGGMLISLKLDGTDYKAVETEGDTFYISHDNGKTLVYFPSKSMLLAVPSEEYGTTVWNVEANICRPSKLPQSILLSYDRQTYLTRCYHSVNKGALCELTQYGDEQNEERINIYAIPDESGKIVRVVMDLEGYFTMWENEETDLIEYEELYYADGFLYFTVKYSVWDKDTCIGWRDGYRRLRSEVYRLKMGESAAQMLYSY